MKNPDIFKSIHLSASAGSGKTRALKERYLALLDELDERGLNIDQAVAITFTDKAAAEIKERVMHDLPEAMLKKIIRGRQDLRISTIHSFCMNLLKRYPLEAGLPPDFGLLDARDQAYKIQKAIEDTLEESDRDMAIMTPLKDFTSDDLVAGIEYLLSIRSRLKRMEIDAGGHERLLLTVRAGLGVDRKEAELKAFIRSTDWRTSLQRMELILRAQGDHYDDCLGKEHLLLSEAKDEDSAFQVSESIASIYLTSTGSPRKNPYIPKKIYNGDRSEYEKLYSHIQELVGNFQSLYKYVRAGREADSLLKLFQLAERKYKTSKLREGTLDFDDLEIHAYSLLQGLESPDILYWLDRKILHFLVDEFQDTSDIQWAILNRLTEEIFAGYGAEKRMPPTLFVVGDEKQSIYRFREANYRLIETVKQKMEKNLPPESREVLTLDKNFRSTPQIIETANKVFAALWGDAYKPSETERKKHAGSVRLIELAHPAEAGQSTITEAEALAREIKSLIASETVVYEKNATNEGDERPAAYGDCAILIQSRTRLKEYESALQAENIPYRVVGGIGFYEEDEIQAVMNVLFFLWNHDDKLSLTAALKSSLFGLTDNDIYGLVRNHDNMIDGLKKQCPSDWELLHGWMNIAGLVPLSNLVHRIIEDSGAYVRFGKRNPQAIFNIDKLLDTAREFDRRGYITLQDFVEWVKNFRQTEQREATADITLPGFQGSVSILTVHKAKGLEFPVVFLPGMNQQPKSLSTGPLAIVDDTDGTVRLAVKDPASPLYNEMWQREYEELLREHQRLLYVAITRARDHLVMIGTLNNGKTAFKQNSWLNYMHEAAPKPLFDSKIETEQGLTFYLYPSTPSLRTESPGPGVVRNDNQNISADENIDIETVIENLSPVPRSDSPEWKKPTDYILHQESVEKTIIPAGVLSPLTRGSVLHRCLEDVTVTGICNVEKIFAEFPEILALEQNTQRQAADELTAVVNAVLNKTDFKWIFESKADSYSELPFLYRKGQTLVSGVMDRVVIREDTGYVIDYKAILPENDEALAGWLDHYRPQVQIYCEAVKELFGVRTVKGYLLFLDSNKLEICTTM